MGLTTWKNAPKGKILKTDVTIAKNYLSEKEIDELNRIVNMYLDYAENQAKRHKVVTMKEWAEKLDSFLQAISALKSPKNYITYTHTSS